jgi:hypothetical protein
METKKILLTFDYELFLGNRSGSVNNCLIIPTNKILDILNSYHLKGVFFIDTSYLYRLSSLTNPKAKSDLTAIENQLIEMVKSGHYIFHHIHPHWLDAKYLEESNEWDLSDNSRFVFSSISDEERNILFSFSNDFLRKIYTNANSDKTPNGFRAGGLFVEPLATLIPFFKKYEIKYEFSVVPGSVRDDYPFAHDFSLAPRNRPYNFSYNLSEESESGEFTEFPISILELSGLDKLINSFYYRLNKKNSKYKTYGDGISVSNKVNAGNSIKRHRSFLNMKVAISVEILNPGNVSVFTNMINQQSYLHLLSHPKLITPISLEQLNLFLKQVSKKHRIESFEFR